MRLSKFILSNLEPIIADWVVFARTIRVDKDQEELVLRDHAKEILETIALDMETAQSDLEQSEKSKGRGRRSKADTAAESHSTGRLKIGFDQAQIVSEFRALRASVIRLWLASSPENDESTVYQLNRFNEGIDQALAESAERFMQEIEKSRDFAVAVLAHDLRDPLNTILSSAQFLLRGKSYDEAAVKAVCSSIVATGSRMSDLINTLVDFTRTRLGQRLPVNRKLTDIGAVCRRTAEEFVAAHPQRVIHFNRSGVLEGAFDSTRVAEMVSNLIANAIHHGGETSPINVSARGESEGIVIQVHNYGPPIPPSRIATIFDHLPVSGREDTAEGNKSSHLGIGLLVTRQIAEAHLGTVSVTSSQESGTTFTVRLPRSLSPGL